MNWAYGAGLITGNGSYVFPKQNMYEEVVGGDYVDPEPWETFRNKDSWSEPNVRPDDSVTREELAVMLQRMASIAAPTTQARSTTRPLWLSPIPSRSQAGHARRSPGPSARASWAAAGL